jgi:nitrate reductase gamma subunit
MRFRVALPSFPEAAADVLCVICLAILLGFLARRLILPRVRALSDAGDLVVILLVAAPFASAWLAYHQAFNYRDILIAHMLLGELLIAALPFTKLGHLPFLLYARLFMAGEGGARRAARGWAR